MKNVFEKLNKYSKPFIFASSQMSSMTYSPYGVPKKIGELYSNSLNGLIVKFWNVYGIEHNMEKSHVITDLIHKGFRNKKIDLLTDGEEQREFLHADDLGEACVFALENWSALAENAPCDDAGQPLAFLNVGTGVDLSIHQLANRIAATVGCNGTVERDTSKPDGTPKKQLDVSRLRSMGWTAAISLSEGLAQAYADFKQALSTNSLRG